MIALLIGAIVYLYISEWRQLEKLEQEVKHINVLRQKVHDAYAKKLELAMYGETILEWDATDTLRYRSKRLQLDSLLCEFKQALSDASGTETERRRNEGGTKK